MTKHHKIRTLHSAIQATILSSKEDIRNTSVPLTRLLARDPDNLFETDWQERTPFHVAAFYGALGCLKVMHEILENAPFDEETETPEFSKKRLTILLATNGNHRFHFHFLQFSCLDLIPFRYFRLHSSSLRCCWKKGEVCGLSYLFRCRRHCSRS